MHTQEHTKAALAVHFGKHPVVVLLTDAGDLTIAVTGKVVFHITGVSAYPTVAVDRLGKHVYMYGIFDGLSTPTLVVVGLDPVAVVIKAYVDVDPLLEVHIVPIAGLDVYLRGYHPRTGEMVEWVFGDDQESVDEQMGVPADMDLCDINVYATQRLYHGNGQLATTSNNMPPSAPLCIPGIMAAGFISATQLHSISNVNGAWYANTIRVDPMAVDGQHLQITGTMRLPNIPDGEQYVLAGCGTIAYLPDGVISPAITVHTHCDQGLWYSNPLGYATSGNKIPSLLNHTTAVVN